TINSLAINSTVTFTGSGILTINSGAYAGFLTPTFNGPTLDFGTGTGYLHLGFPVNIQGTSSITGSGGVVVDGATTGRTLAITNTVANPFSGGLYLNGFGAVSFNTADNQLGATSGLLSDAIYIRG